MPVRSPLTAAARQCSRRPDRHVVCPIDKFPPMAFLRFNKQSQQYKEIIRKPKTPL